MVKLIWNEQVEIDDEIREVMEEYLDEDPETDCFFEGVCADMSRYSGFQIREGRIYQTTGAWVFYPVQWVCVRAEKYADLITLLESLQKEKENEKEREAEGR